MSEPSASDHSLPPELAREFEGVCNRFEASWKDGTRPRIEDYLALSPESVRALLTRELVLLELHHRKVNGEACQPADYLSRFPNLGEDWLDDARTRLQSDEPKEGANPAGDQAPTEAAKEACQEPQNASDPSAPPAQAGERLGPYKLLQKLGEGGMGLVYLAEQEHPVKRRVALKIIKPGMDSGEVLRRFETERLALALMDHPNIARVLDAGTTDNGRPYFVMELVQGLPITRHCDREHLTPHERLALFIMVCQAVQHAHQKGIIHRDLKPSNILVATFDGRPVPKVIDFGIAKAIGRNLTEGTHFTELGQIVGTLEYMSPEQAELNSLDVDTRSDVYALGVVLYELLVGSPPFTTQQLRSAAFTEMLRMIREVEPLKPSDKLSSSDHLPAIAASRRLDPRQLTRMVHGDLDWIAMKCLSKDRGQRYGAANELAMEIQRYLADEPVQAGPPSAVYRLRKFVKRHQGPVLASTGLGLLLALGALGTGWGLQEAQRGRQAAEQAISGEKEASDRAAGAEKTALVLADNEKAALAQVEAKQRAATFQGYRAECAKHANAMDLALRAWEQHDLLRTEQLLDAVPGPFQQTWETRFVRELCRRMTVPLTGIAESALSADGLSIVTSDDAGVATWDAPTGKKKRTFPSPKAPVAISRDGSTIVIEQNVWDATNGRKKFALKGHADHLFRIAISADGKQIAAVSKGKVDTHDLTIWDGATGLEKFTFLNVGKCMAMSADGQTVVTGAGADIKLWSVRSGKELRTLKGHASAVASVAISADGQRVVSADMSPTDFGGGDRAREVKIWDASSGQETRTIKGERDEAINVALSGDGKTIAMFAQLVTKDQPGLITVWNADTGRQLGSLRGHTGDVQAVAIDADGARVLSLGADRTGEHSSLRIWSMVARPESLTLQGHKGPVLSVSISGDGKRIASGGDDQTVKVWDGLSAQPSLSIDGHTSEVRSVVLSADGQRILSGSGPLQGGVHGEINAWDARSGKTQFALECELPVFSLASSLDGSSIIAGGGTRGAGELPMFGELAIRDGRTGRPERTLGDGVTNKDEKSTLAINAVAMSRDGRTATSACVDGTVIVWDTVTGQARVRRREQFAAKCVAMSSDAGQIASGNGMDVKVWDAQTGNDQLILRGHTAQVHSVAFSSDGQRLISGSEDQTVKVWDVRTGQEMLSLRGHTDAVTSVAHGGERIVSGSSDGTAKLWDAPATAEVLRLAHSQPLTAVAISVDGRFIVSGCGWMGAGGPSELKIWDAQTGEQKFSLQGHEHYVHSVGISANGERVVSSDMATIKVWDGLTGQQKLSINGEFDQMALSADGQTIVSASGDFGKPGQLKTWDRATGKQKRSLKGHTGQIYRVAISADGQRISSAAWRPDKSGAPGGGFEAIVWDVVAGKPLLTLSDPKAVFAISSSGERVISVVADRIKFFDTKSGQEVATLAGNWNDQKVKAISADGRRLICETQSGTKLIDARSGRGCADIQPYSGSIVEVALSADGTLIVSGNSDQMVSVWRVP